MIDQPKLRDGLIILPGKRPQGWSLHENIPPLDSNEWHETVFMAVGGFIARVSDFNFRNTTMWCYEEAYLRAEPYNEPYNETASVLAQQYLYGSIWIEGTREEIQHLITILDLTLFNKE